MKKIYQTINHQKIQEINNFYHLRLLLDKVGKIRRKNSHQSKNVIY